MVKNKLAIFIDSFSLSFIVFIISYFWLYKLNVNNAIIYLLSISITTLSFILILSLFIKKNNIKIKNKIDKEKLKNCKNTLLYNSAQSNISFFEKLTSSIYLSNNIYKNSSAIFYIKTHGKLDCNDFFIANNFYQTNKISTVLLFICDGFTDEFSLVLENSPIKFNIYFLDDLFIVMKEKNLFPEKKLCDSSQNLINKNNKEKSKLKINFNKLIENIKFKESFFSGLSLVILSIFIPYSLYYLILGTLFLALSFISIFSKNNNNLLQKNNKKNIEDYCK